MTISLRWYTKIAVFLLEEVASVFFDDCSIDKDDFASHDEQRTLTIGMSNQARLLVVVWTQRENMIRIITAFFPAVLTAVLKPP
ncbi:BrnT family toxin [Streptococcus sp. S784/96/1]|uniref:BrnT family toxin n=1 Tax=Streptococcus sp. S784/96/1 TaxID=2653499 RepID=UPI00192E5409|nr:BrnT family toxin [Streptococcus sp. S784/96/1]